jgi:hypothetical protein
VNEVELVVKQCEFTGEFVKGQTLKIVLLAKVLKHIESVCRDTRRRREKLPLSAMHIDCA